MVATPIIMAIGQAYLSLLVMFIHDFDTRRINQMQKQVKGK